MAAPAKFKISVVYAMPAAQTEVSLSVTSGTTVREAILQSDIQQRHPEVASHRSYGIFGQQVSGDQEVVAGDRVEIYRPLPADPKDTRRALARSGQTMARTQVKSRQV